MTKKVSIIRNHKIHDIEIAELRKSNRKSIALMINKDAEVILKVPFFLAQQDIERFVISKISWIYEKVNLVKQKSEKRIIFSLDEGSELPILGKNYKIQFSYSHTSRILIIDDKIVVATDLVKYINKNLALFYTYQAKKILSEKVKFWAAKSGLIPKRIKINSARKRWGSCSSKGTLNFTWRLILAPEDVVDYIVVHELSHIKHHDHSRNFWNTVNEIYPQYKIQEKWLNENSYILDFLSDE